MLPTENTTAIVDEEPPSMLSAVPTAQVPTPKSRSRSEELFGKMGNLVSLDGLSISKAPPPAEDDKPADLFSFGGGLDIYWRTMSLGSAPESASCNVLLT